MGPGVRPGWDYKGWGNGVDLRFGSEMGYALGLGVSWGWGWELDGSGLGLGVR